MGETRFKMTDVVPIRTTPATVWLITFESGRKIIDIWHPDATIDDVLRSYQLRPSEKFTIRAVTVGNFDVSNIITCFSSDGRAVDQDGYIV